MSNSLTSPEWQNVAANPNLPPVEVMAAFEREIARQEDIAYGVALCVVVLITLVCLACTDGLVGSVDRGAALVIYIRSVFRVKD